jgi:tetratricopeptide (TPR) repeat protein
MMAKLLSGGIEQDDLQTQVIPHFLAWCPVCRERCREVRRLQDEVGHWNEEVAVFEGQEAPELWQRLEGLTFEEQVKRVDEEEDLHAWGFCQLLLRKSREAGFDDPAAAVDLANLAVKVSSYLNEAYDPNWVWDLRARTFAYLGNARRVLGELRSSEDAFRKAERCLARSSTGNEEIRAEVLDLKSSLRRAQRRFGEALTLVDQVLAFRRKQEDSRGLGKVLLKKAQILSEAGRPDEAISLLHQSCNEIDPSQEPGLFAYARYNLLCGLTLDGRYAEAGELLPEVRDRFSALEQPLNLVRLHWTEGKIAFGLSRVTDAESSFQEVRREFAARGMSYDVALVSLDLALLFHQEGRAAELKRLTGELLTIFEAQDIHREALGAFYLFQKASLEERLTADIITRLAGVLRRYRPGNGV